MTENKRPVLARVLLIAVFLLGIVIARLVCPRMNLPLHNPWHVTGAPSILNFSPSTNRLRYLCVVSLPSILLLLCYLVPVRKLKNLCFPPASAPASSDKSPKAHRRSWILVCTSLVVLFVVVSLNVPTEISSGSFDTFHEGEALGPATAYLHGQAPYRDFLVVHGYFQDVGGCVTAFKLFGHSISAVRTLWSILKVLRFALLVVLLGIIFDGAYLPTFGAGILLLLLLCPSTAVGGDYQALVQTIGRDLTNVVFLVCVMLLYKSISKAASPGLRVPILGFASAFVAVSSLAFSVDRGSYLMLAYALLLPILYFAYVRGRPLREQILRHALPLVLGAGAGVLLLGFVTQWNLVDFAKFAFLILPKYFPLLDSVPYSLEVAWPFLVMALVAANTFWIVLKYLQRRASGPVGTEPLWRGYVTVYFPEISLSVVALILFLSALGISDTAHITTYGFTSYLLAIVILMRHVSFPSKRIAGMRKVCGIGLGILAAVMFCVAVSNVADKGLLAENFPLGTPDSDYIPADHSATIDFLRSNLGPNDSFLTLTNEASWYYFLDRPSPIRFAVACLGATDFYQREAIRDIEKKNVEFVIVQNSNWSNAILGIPTEARLPILAHYIAANYVFFRQIDSNTIYVKRR